MADKIFCVICEKEKGGKFCEYCRKETPNSLGRIKKIECNESVRSFDSLGGGVGRGEISWAYFPIAYTIILALVVGIVSSLDIVCWAWRIIMIIIFAGLFFYLCFCNDYFRNKIVGFFNKLKGYKEKF